MSKLALHFYLHTPLGTSESLFKSSVENLYTPLIKLFKTTKDFKFSLSVSLATLEQLDTLGYTHVLNDLKALIQDGVGELVICPAYNSSKTYVGIDFFERQLILNEYALGYYFGLKQSFEGDPAILIKDISGVYLPNDVLDVELKEMVEELDYKWAKDSTSLSQDLSSKSIAIDDEFAYLRESMSFNESISNYLGNETSTLNVSSNSAFEYNFTTINVIDLFSKNPTFVYKLSKLLDYFKSNNVEYTSLASIYTEAIDESKFSSLDLTALVKSSPVLKPIGGSLQELLLPDMLNNVKESKRTHIVGYENSPIWLEKELNNIEDSNTHSFSVLSRLSDVVMLKNSVSDLSPYYMTLVLKLSAYSSNSSLKDFITSIK